MGSSGRRRCDLSAVREATDRKHGRGGGRCARSRRGGICEKVGRGWTTGPPMSPAEIIQAERRELARLWRECHVTMCFCEHCGRDEWAAVDGDDVICLRCAKLRIESMAEARSEE